MVLRSGERVTVHGAHRNGDGVARAGSGFSPSPSRGRPGWGWGLAGIAAAVGKPIPSQPVRPGAARRSFRSEEHTSELQSLMRNSYAVFCLKKKNIYQERLSMNIT